MTELACTPGQTVGPFFGLGLPYSGGSDLVGAAYPGAVRLHGTVYDGAGDGVPDALVELWQPDAAGRIPRAVGSLRRDGVTFTGFGRSATDPDGRYAFTTVAPGAASSAANSAASSVASSAASRRKIARRRPVPCDFAGGTSRLRGTARQPGPRFFAITVFARGLLNHLFTRAYLPDVDVSADPLLATLDAARRASLLCVAESGSGGHGYRFDIHLQGPNETVFLAYRDDRR
jgi:protocatechuate 3,4-dioxygenase alpha subunit